MADGQDSGALRVVGPGSERERYLDLLLLADESPEQVAGYMHDGDLFVFADGPDADTGLVLVLYEADGSAELKAVAVRPDRQGQGVGRRMVTRVLDRLRRTGVRRVTVATGNSGLAPLALYQKSGFRLWKIERDFFSPERGYPEGMEENGIPLRDLVWLDLDLSPGCG